MIRERIILTFMILLISTSLFSQTEKDVTSKIQSFSYEVKIYNVLDSTLFQLLDSVLISERTTNKYFSDSVYFGINVIPAKDSDLSTLTVVGTDIKRLFIESKELVGLFKYKGHYFFLLSDLNELFSKTCAYHSFEINSSDEEISDDDRWPFYYFGYDGDSFFIVSK
jgi:hypothetical protein